MAEQQPRPILITGGGRRIGLALAHHFLLQHQPVIVSYRTPYPAIDGLRDAGARVAQAPSVCRPISAAMTVYSPSPKRSSRTPAVCAPSSTTPATGWRRSRGLR